MNAIKESNSELQNIALACPNCKTMLGYKGTTDNNNFALFECKTGHCPLKAVVLVTEQVSEIMKPMIRR